MRERVHEGTSTRGNAYTRERVHEGTSTRGNEYTRERVHEGTSTRGNEYTRERVHEGTSTQVYKCMRRSCFHKLTISKLGTSARENECTIYITQNNL